MTALAQEVSELVLPDVHGPGRRLREAREARRLTLEDVAAELRLGRQVVEALEHDDYSGLPPPAFVRGYLRSYAHLLDVPEGSVLEAYERLQGVVPVGEIPEFRAMRQVSSRDGRVRWVTYLVVAALVALPFVWWQTQGSFRFWETVSGGRDGTDSSTPPAIEAPPAKPLASTADSPNEMVMVPDAGDLEREFPVSEMEAAAIGSMEAPELYGGAAQDGNAEDQVVETATTTESTADAGSLSDEPGSVGRSDELTIRASADSWVSVTDADGQRLIYRVLGAGSEKTLRGKAPFRVVLGNSRGVTVVLNGVTIDQSRYEREGVARFEVGKEQEGSGGAGAVTVPSSSAAR